MKRWTGLLVIVAFAAGLAAAATPPLKPWFREGPVLQGRLLAEAFRPAHAGLCDDPTAKDAARVAFSATRTLLATALHWMSPGEAAARALAGCQQFALRRNHNLIVNAGETFLRDAWINTVELEIMKYHGVGTGVTAAAEGDTGCQTESTTALNPDNTRATGTLVAQAQNVFRTVGTLTADATIAATEWCLMSQAATGGGTMWSHVIYTVVNLASLDSIQFTYDLTIE